MTFETWLLFVLATAALIATPGPNVALVVGTTLRHGRTAGLLAVAGVNAGVVLQLCTVAAGLTWIVEVFSAHFDLIRYLGAGYLIFLAVQQWRAKPVSPGVAAPALAPERAFARGFLIAFANPKTLVFFAAFLPLFIDPNAGDSTALWILAATFAVIAAGGDTLFVLAAARLGHAVSGRYARIADKASAAILLGGAAVLLAAGRR
ncbi:LysE family translocator [Blastochloris sulfoviridis]|uniref:LysE family translocator n=1 Tax=Blastochloris sulfoviridis TaxID=50712 RepID=A0A5M6I1C8_9HYPH|nr:LysE family translocator [Blastochloris sulfoviridis]KAA5601677.1 LysE family translocator [Blastochloris sulfoviridis]